MSYLGFISTRLGALKCLAGPNYHTPTKTSEDPVRPEPRTPGLRVKHFTTAIREVDVCPPKMNLEQQNVNFYHRPEGIFELILQDYGRTVSGGV